MKPALLFLLFALLNNAAAQAQDYLVPDSGLLAKPDTYFSKLSEIFSAAYKDEVVLKVFVVAPRESVVGIRKIAANYEVFCMTPSSSVWDTESIRDYESGRIGIYKDGKEIPYQKDEGYLALKARIPSDYRKITVKTETTRLDALLTKRIAPVWETMLLAARHPTEPSPAIAGGFTLYYSMFIGGRGVISGHNGSSVTGKSLPLQELAFALSRFATGEIDTKQLTDALSRSEGQPTP